MGKILEKNINTSEHYDNVYSGDDFRIDFMQPKRARLLLVKLKREDKYLDLACGLAPHFLMAYAITDKVWASDFSSFLIKKRQNQFKETEMHFVCDDIRDSGFEDNFFDYISAGEILEHLEDPDSGVKEMVRMLKKDGILAISVPNNDEGKYAPEHHVWSFMKDELENILSKYGDVKIETLNETDHEYLIAYLTKK